MTYSDHTFVLHIHQCKYIRILVLMSRLYMFLHLNKGLYQCIILKQIEPKIYILHCKNVLTSLSIVFFYGADFFLVLHDLELVKLC